MDSIDEGDNSLLDDVSLAIHQGHGEYSLDEESKHDDHQQNAESAQASAQYQQNLEEIFKCFICLNKVQNAVMCPNCSKLCCSGCIKVALFFTNDLNRNG